MGKENKEDVEEMEKVKKTIESDCPTHPRCVVALDVDVDVDERFPLHEAAAGHLMAKRMGASSAAQHSTAQHSMVRHSTGRPPWCRRAKRAYG